MGMGTTCPLGPSCPNFSGLPCVLKNAQRAGSMIASPIFVLNAFCAARMGLDHMLIVSPLHTAVNPGFMTVERVHGEYLSPPTNLVPQFTFTQMAWNIKGGGAYHQILTLPHFPTLPVEHECLQRVSGSHICNLQALKGCSAFKFLIHLG